MQLWVEQFLRIELQQKWKVPNGKYSDTDWTRRIERYLIKCSLIHDCITLRAAMLADLYWFIRFLCLLYLNITSNSIKYRMKISKLIVLYNPALPKSCIFTMNFLWQPGQIKNDVPYGPEEWSSKLTTDNMMGFGLSQYMHRKTIDLIRSIISCFALEKLLLRNPNAKLLIPQGGIYSE